MAYYFAYGSNLAASVREDGAPSMSRCSTAWARPFGPPLIVSQRFSEKIVCYS